MTLAAGIAIWCAGLVLVAYLSAHPVGARVGLVVAAILLPLPAFVAASPLNRCLLGCFIGASFVRAADLLRAPPAGFPARLALLCAYFDTHQVKRRPRRFDVTSLPRLAVSAAVLAGAIAAVKVEPAGGCWLPIRWLAGGIGLLAIAEMATACHDLVTTPLGLAVPPLFRSPYRATSVREFWTERWNLAASVTLRKYCFAPLARRSTTLALGAAFAASAAGHALLTGLALGSRVLAVSCATFFLAQPLLLAVERRMAVRRWPPAAGRVWTLTALALTSPLVVEPVLQMVEKVWGAPDDVLQPTAAALGFCIVVSMITSLVSLTCRSGGLGREVAESGAAPDRGGM